jgi:signal transduction histidine kinase
MGLLPGEYMRGIPRRIDPRGAGGYHGSMFYRIRRSAAQHPYAVDAVVAVALACFLGLAALSPRWSADPSPSVLFVVATAVTALPLAVRRRSPYGALAGTLVLLGVAYAVSATSTAFSPPVIPVLPSVIALYTVGTVGSRRTTLVVGAVALMVAIALHLVILRPSHVIQEIVHPIAWVIGSLAVGAAVANHRAYIDQFRQRALQAERSKEEEAQRRVSEERIRIARDVHDGVAHALASISIQASAGAAVIDSDPEGARQALKAIRLASASALSDLRATLGLLRHEDGDVTERGLDDEEIDRLAEVVRAEGIRVSVHRGGHGRPLNTEVGAAAHRILQEALTNVLRHSEAREIEIGLDYVKDELILIVTDDGKGPATTAKEPPGYGLMGMRERAVAVGGSLEYGPRQGGGFYVQAVLPFEGGR